jgi:hypothetical protein
MSIWGQWNIRCFLPAQRTQHGFASASASPEAGHIDGSRFQKGKDTTAMDTSEQQPAETGDGWLRIQGVAAKRKTTAMAAVAVCRHIYLGLGEALAGARDELGEVGVHEVEDEVDAAVHPGGGDALEADDVGVVEPLQDPDLPRHEPHALRLRRVEPHLLERHHPPRPALPRLVHVAVRALPDLLDLVVGVGAPGHDALQRLAGHVLEEPRRPPVHQLVLAPRRRLRRERRGRRRRGVGIVRCLVGAPPRGGAAAAAGGVGWIRGARRALGGGGRRVGEAGDTGARAVGVVALEAVDAAAVAAGGRAPRGLRLRAPHDAGAAVLAPAPAPAEEEVEV